MISSIEWIPAGIADPNPKKYEYSTTERELLQQMIEMEEQQNRKDDDDDNNNNNNNNNNSDNDDQQQQKPNLEKGETNNNRHKGRQQQQEQEQSQLPADLRMDEYSDDDEDEDDNDMDDYATTIATTKSSARSSVRIGRLLVGNDDENNNDDEDDVEIDDDDGETNDKDQMNGPDSDDDDDDDDDDDLADVPDTREYEPFNVQTLQQVMNTANNNNNKNRHQGTRSRNNSNDILDHNDDIDVDDDEEELEDVALTSNDALIVVAKTEDDFASLEVYVYDQYNGNLFVHHDISLPAYPICLAHGQVSYNSTIGNYIAVGTFDMGIEIWNLDILNVLEPSCILGGEDTTIADDIMKQQILNNTGSNSSQRQSKNNNNKKKNKNSTSHNTNNGLREGSHTDAVMSLSWNTIHKQVIASGSADHTVKLWDVTKAEHATTYTHHKNKVQSVAWNPKEGTLLATGSYDKTVSLLDARSNNTNNKNTIKNVRITADCETIVWDPIHTEYLTVVSEDGIIKCWDVRKFDTSTPVWTVSGSEYGGITDISYNAHIPGLMVSCSIDKTITLWDTHNMDQTSSTTIPQFLPPKQCYTKDMCVGKLYTCNFYPSSPWLLGCGGSGNELALWDMSQEETIQKLFAGRSVNNSVIQQQPIDIETSDKDVDNNNVSLEASFHAMMTNKNDEMKNNSIDEKSNQHTSNSSNKKKKSKGKMKPKVHRKI